MKVIHVTVYGDLPAGVRKQIGWEAQASQQLKGDVQWDQLAIHGGQLQEPFEQRIPRPLRCLILRNLYVWWTLLSLSRRYDYVLLRHMPFDPFVFVFAPFIGNRISIHHSKETDELPRIRPGLKGRLAAWLERYSGWCAVRTAKAVLGVTHELAEYQTQTRAPGKPCSVYHNGIVLSDVALLPDARDPERIEAVFICHTFSYWHGLDRLIDAIERAQTIPEGMVIHLIGHLSDTQKQAIQAMGERAAIFQIHGFLETQAYRALLSRCDISIGSLAMDRIQLRQGTTLKVREMLALGVPLYSYHEDSAIPPDFPYYVNQEVVFDEIVAFARRMKAHSREQMREAAAPYIDKRASMQKVVEWLRTL